MADPLILTPGQIALPDDFRAVLQQHAAGGNDIKSVQPIPLTDPKVKGLLAEDGFDPEQTPPYRYYLGDGSMVEAVTQQDGSYRIISYQPSTRFTQQHPANAAAAATGTTGSNPRVPAGSIPQIEGTPVPGQPGQFDNTQPIRAWHAPDGSVIYEPLTPAEVLDWQKQKNGGKTDAEMQAAQVAAQGAVGSKMVQVNGKTYYAVTTTVPATASSPATTKESYEDENHNPIAQLPVQVKPGEVIKGGGPTGEDVQAIVDPTTGAIKYQPIPGAQTPAGNRPMPAGTPSFTPDPSDPTGDYGITKYGQQVRQFQSVHPELTNEQARSLIVDAGEVVKTVDARSARDALNASATRAQDLTQRTQDLGEVQSRRSSADAGYDTLYKTMQDSAPHLGRGNGQLASQAFRAALADRQIYARQAGGYATVPPVGAPPSYLQHTTTYHPDGTTVVSHTVPAPAAAPPAVQGTPSAVGDTGAPPVGAPPVAASAPSGPTFANPDGSFGIPGSFSGGPDQAAAGAPSALAPSLGAPPSYLQAPPQQWSHDDTVAELRARGIPDDAIREGLALHYAGYGSAA